MVTENQDSSSPTCRHHRRCLIVGNYCHDVLIKDDAIVGESLGGAASFISAVLDGLDIPSDYVSKVGSDFAYAVNHDPIISPTSETTLFHAHFWSKIQRQDRALKRVRACDPILPPDLPDTQFEYGLAVGVGGEILPETLEKMLDICELVFVDIQALIRDFDSDDGTVNLIALKETKFSRLVPRIGFLKASAEEALYMDVEEARKECFVVVTNGKDGCNVYWKDGEQQIAPFPTVQIDPTGAGDSFLGGLVAGLFQGLAVPDAALLGNFFGSLTVGQIGLAKFDARLLQRVKDELQKQTLQCIGCNEWQENELNFAKPLTHEQFHAALSAAKLISTHSVEEYQHVLPSCTRAVEQHIHQQCNGQQKVVLLNTRYEEPIRSAESRP